MRDKVRKQQFGGSRQLAMGAFAYTSLTTSIDRATRLDLEQWTKKFYYSYLHAVCMQADDLAVGDLANVRIGKSGANSLSGKRATA